jgi:hypothetical protein
MGSDYFVLPVFLNFFETATYDYVGEKLKIIEKTQEITDDIRSLIVPKDISIVQDPLDSQKYIAPIPTDYLRLVAHSILYADGSKCIRSDLTRYAELATTKRNPNTAPNKQFPIILQYEGYFEIDSGSTVPTKLKLTYCKKPTFATTGQPGTRIVNLPDDSIEKILKITVTNLFNKTADERTQSSYQLQETYQKVFK